MLLDIDGAKALVLLLTTVSIASGVYLASGDARQRLLLLLWILGFFLYSGVATTDVQIPYYLLISYILFLLATLAGFFVANSALRNLERIIVARAGRFLDSVAEGKLPLIVISLFLSIKFFHLLVPELKVGLLFSPPAPDIESWFASRFDSDKSTITSAINYAEIMILPFFYYSLYRLKRNPSGIFVVLVISLYIEYVSASYLGRYNVLFALAFLFLCVWHQYPRLRKLLLAIAVGAAPILGLAAYSYSLLRLGLSPADVSVSEAILELLGTELTFLLEAGVPIIESGITVDLFRYAMWVLTLPIPGFLKSGLDLALVNYEISAIVLGRQPGEPGFYIVLPGLLSESFFIFGSIFFWLHGTFIGVLMALFYRALGRVQSLRFLFFYVCIVFFLVLNRGGIGATLPPLVNGFILFATVLFLVVIRKQQGLVSSPVSGQARR